MSDWRGDILRLDNVLLLSILRHLIKWQPHSFAHCFPLKLVNYRFVFRFSLS